MAKTKEQEEQERQNEERRQADEAAARRLASSQGVTGMAPKAATQHPKDPAQIEAEARAILANRASGAETKPVGITIRGGKPGPDGKHYGGEVVNSEGKVMNTFKDDEENTGKPKEDAEAKVK